MGGSDKHQARGHGGQFVAEQSFVVGRDRKQARTVRAELLRGAPVMRLFDGHGISFVEQHACSQRDGLLGAADDQHVIN